MRLAQAREMPYFFGMSYPSLEFRARLGAQLRRSRQLVGLRLVDVAAELGVHFARVSDWERGRAAPSVEQLAQLARLYGATLDELAAA